MITLGARDHMACLGASVPDMGQSSLLPVLAGSPQARLPRSPSSAYICGVRTVARNCRRQGRGTVGRRSPLLVNPGAKAVETRVYLYGLRDLDGQEQARVEYRSIRLNRWPLPARSCWSANLKARPPTSWQAGPSARESTPHQSGPHRDVRVEAGAAGRLDPRPTRGWNLTGFGKSSATQCWMASWVVDGQAVDGSARYLPIEEPLGLYLLPIAVVAAFLAIWAGTLWRRRRRCADG